MSEKASGGGIVFSLISTIVGAALGFGGAWYLQEQNLAASNRATQQQTREADALRAQAQLRQAALDLQARWQEPALFAARRALQIKLQSLGQPKPIAELTDSLSPSDLQNLSSVLAYFDQVRVLSGAGQLDTPALSQMLSEYVDYWRPYLGGCASTSDPLIRNASIGLEDLVAAKPALGSQGRGVDSLLAQAEAQMPAGCTAEPVAIGPRREGRDIQG